MGDAELIRLVTERVVAELAARSNSSDYVIPIGVSVRHVHITQADLEILYGAGAVLTKLKDLYQEGEFASKETVTLVGPKMRALSDVRILGPFRKKTQVEVSRTDAILLGIDPPVRPSGDHSGSSGLTLVGPKGSIHLDNGVILANRHIHMSLRDAERFGVKDNDIVKVHIPGDKALTFEGVQVRVAPNFKLEMHLDTDDANSAGARCGVKAKIVR